MAERVRQREAPGVAERDSVDVKRLPHLIDGARASTGDDQVALALEINQVLIAMRGPGDEEQEAGVVLSALEAHHLDGLVDGKGRSCRKEAVETLLATGFPHALRVNPEDLAFARGYRQTAGASPVLGAWAAQLDKSRRIGAALAVAGQLLFLLIALPIGGFGTPGFTVAAAAGLLGGVAAAFFALTKPKIDSQARWGTLIALCGITQLLSALAAGPGALIGGLALLACLAVCFVGQAEQRADPPKPGDWDYRDGG